MDLWKTYEKNYIVLRRATSCVLDALWELDRILS